MAIASFAPEGFTPAQVGVDLLQPAVLDHFRHSHLGRRTGQPLGGGRAMFSGRWAAALRMIVWVTNGTVYGFRAAISIRSLFLGYADLRSDFTDQLDRVIADNTRMLLNALTPRTPCRR